MTATSDLHMCIVMEIKCICVFSSAAHAPVVSMPVSEDISSVFKNEFLFLNFILSWVIK